MREVVVQGLPDVYQPGANYDLYVRWPRTALHVTALVEFTDELGRGAGRVVVPDAALTPEESCLPVEDGVPAALVFAGPELALTNERQLVGMQDCGGAVLHWTWTAPALDVGTVLFAGGVVEPDSQPNAEGDRAASLLRPIGSPSQLERRVELSAGCIAFGRRSESAAAWLVLALLASVRGFYRRTRRTAQQ